MMNLYLSVSYWIDWKPYSGFTVKYIKHYKTMLKFDHPTPTAYTSFHCNSLRLTVKEMYTCNANMQSPLTTKKKY